MKLEKFKGIFPAFYACYDDQGEVSEERTKELGTYLYNKGVKGLYVGGSSGECIYQTIEERKATLKYVSEALKGKFTLIAHVGAPSTRDSVILASMLKNLDMMLCRPFLQFIISFLIAQFINIGPRL